MALLYKVTLSIPSSFLSLVSDYFFFLFLCMCMKVREISDPKSPLQSIDRYSSQLLFLHLSLSFLCFLWIYHLKVMRLRDPRRGYFHVLLFQLWGRGLMCYMCVREVPHQSIYYHDIRFWFLCVVWVYVCLCWVVVSLIERLGQKEEGIAHANKPENVSDDQILEMMLLLMIVGSFS